MTNNNEQLDQMFHALSDATRRGMVDRLCKGPATVSELAEPLDMALPTVMGHLRVLENCGLVRSMKRGRVRTCELEPEQLTQVEIWINERRSLWARRFDRLGEFLAKSEPPNE
ncbi:MULTISPECIES: ArsR/SmtB family transcription factor [Thalassospira]|jgi:DNA-binding transcriptional ArsR family regulator|uniref:ArsR family transcriptional regulator n=1 Tax=Thalassospira xiamenensis TaxID=220697 RepID=A0A367X2X8_9PROT|nr:MULTISPECIES: metalloregulator ArsR/SmtB family transcription factor [Thalassospira]KZB53166.1 ArsR family transcriptional regulator [Thalassospira xiamenensis]MBO9508433.1 helix-turn-helix transcriptional regulator [Thalassospira sp. A3_1]RCK47420.1 ArsR family transcriptional regulator [Thalassospira xiamenensis]WOI09955.1 metalloregulator ArsR/SmtB family transcription factor [Thalassospira lucentensis]